MCVFALNPKAVAQVFTPVLALMCSRTQMSAAAAVFYGYVFLLGFLLFLVLKYFKSAMQLFNIFCIYGVPGGGG